MKIIYGLPNCSKCEEEKQKVINSGEEYIYKDARKYIEKFKELGISEMPYIEEER